MRFSKGFSKIGILIWLFLSAAAGMFFNSRGYFDAQQPKLYEPQYLRQVITADSKTSRVIMWQTTSAEKDAWVEYRVQGNIETQKVQATGKELVTDVGKVYDQSAMLSDLKAATLYEYRVGTSEGLSKWQQLQTDSGGAFTALIFGDSQSLDYNVWRKTAEIAYSNVPEAAFFINVGDLVDNGEQYSQWRSWFNGAGTMLKSIPVAPTNGNHENYSLKWEPYNGELYFSLFDLPSNGPIGLKSHAYSYDYGNVHFAVIDTQQQEQIEWHPKLMERQARWLAADLSGSNKKWKVVVLHRTLFRYQDGSINELGRVLLPIFDSEKVDVVFSGHNHTYGRSVPMKADGTEGVGTVYISCGRSGDKTWEGSRPKPQEVVFDGVLNQPNYLKLIVDDNKMTVVSLRQNGQPIDTVTLTK